MMTIVCRPLAMALMGMAVPVIQIFIPAAR
jgi:hypothetical protein